MNETIRTISDDPIQNQAYNYFLKFIEQREIKPPPPRLKKRLEIWHKTLINLFWEEIARYNSIGVLYDGIVGSGKSYSAIYDAIFIDPFFSLDQIIFSKEQANEQFEIISQEKRRNPRIPRIVIWDEIGVGLHNRDWYQQEQIEIIKKLIAMRTNNINIFACVPHIRYLDSAFDARLNFIVEMARPNPDHPYRFGKVLKPYGFPSERKRISFLPINGIDGRRFYSAYLDPKAKHPELFQEYEVIREEYAYELMQREKKPTGIFMTPREMEYRDLFILGYSITKVAKELNVSTTAVKEMKRKLRRKGLLEPKEE